MPPYLFILICALIGASAPAQTAHINNHQAVVQVVTSSREPLVTWQNILKHHPNDPQAAEQVADAVLSHLQNMPTQEIFVPLLKHWQNHQPVTTRVSDDHGHEVGVYLIAARASGELNRLLSEQTERYIYAIVHSQPNKLVTELTDLYQQSHPAVTAGITAALAHLTPQQQQAIIEQQLSAGQVTTISPLLAIELNSQAIQKMIVLSHQSEAIRALINAWQHKPPNNTSLLQTLVQQPGQHRIQALELFNRIELTEYDTDWLISLLNDDKLGRSAARVLGHQSHEKLMSDLFERWQHSANEPLNTNLLYALSRNTIGLKKLNTLIQQKSPALSKHQQHWLQQLLGADDVK